MFIRGAQLIFPRVNSHNNRMLLQINVPGYILYEDDFIIVLNKPAGLMVEPDRNGHPNLLQLVKNYLKPKIQKEESVYAQHLHRLDRPVSGIVLFTKHRESLRNLSEQFAQRQVRKQYRAITESAPAIFVGTLEHWHRKEKKKAMLTETEVPYSEIARLSYRVVQTARGYAWDIDLHTGRYHQIRAQLSYVGCPILGDTRYGSTTVYRPNAIALHASRLTFLHPQTGVELTLEAPPNFD